MLLANILVLFVVLAVVVDGVKSGLKLSTNSIELLEGDKPRDYTIVLTSMPTSTVLISVQQTLVTSGVIDQQHRDWRDQSHPQLHVNPPVVVFSPDSWDVPKKVSLVALDDSVAERPAVRRIRLEHRVMSSDPNYHENKQWYQGPNNRPSKAAGKLLCTIEEDDEPGIALSAGAIAAVRGGHVVQYTMHLQSQPTADVTIRVTNECKTLPSASDQVEVSPRKLTFTQNDWKDPQTIVVRALDNGDRNCDSSRCSAQTHTIHHTSESSDPSFSGTLTQLTPGVGGNQEERVSRTRTRTRTRTGLFSHLHTNAAPNLIHHLRHAGDAKVVVAVHDSDPLERRKGSSSSSSRSSSSSSVGVSVDGASAGAPQEVVTYAAGVRQEELEATNRSQGKTQKTDKNKKKNKKNNNNKKNKKKKRKGPSMSPDELLHPVLSEEL